MNLSLFAGNGSGRNSDRLYGRNGDSFDDRSDRSSDGNNNGSHQMSPGGGMGGKMSGFGLGHFGCVLNLSVASDLVAKFVIRRKRCCWVVDESSGVSVERADCRESGVTRVEAIGSWIVSAKVSSRIQTVPEVVQPLTLDRNSQNQETSNLS